MTFLYSTKLKKKQDYLFQKDLAIIGDACLFERKNMNKKLYAGISQILLGALVAIAPQTFAHVCAVKEMPMACHYTAQAALGIGIVIAVLGVAGLFVSNQTRAGLDIANAVLGVLTITVPTVLIGVCKGAMMHCHMVTLPTLIVLGVLLAVLASIAAYLDLKPAKRA